MSPTLTKALTYLRAPANEVGWRLRRTFRYRRGSPLIVNEPKATLFDYLSPAEQVLAERQLVELERRYDLQPFKWRSSRYDYRDNLYLLDALEQLWQRADVDLRDNPRVVDVGSGCWNYVFALQRFFSRVGSHSGPRPVDLTGVELDGYILGKDLRARVDRAEAYVAQLEGEAVRYLVGDFMELDVPKADVVTMLYPFLTRFPLLRWGLPLSCYQPRKILERALQTLRPGGLMIVFNHTACERDRLVSLARELNATVHTSMPLDSKLVDYWGEVSGRWASLLTLSEPEP